MIDLRHYRAIFFITQALDDSYNTKSMGGYYRSSREDEKQDARGYIESEIDGKSFIVKAPMVIPSQLPQYYAKKYDESNSREPRKNSTDQNMQTDEDKDILGYNQDEFMRWKEQQYKLHDNLVVDGTGGFMFAGQKTLNNENGGALALEVLGDESEGSDESDESGEDGEEEEEGEQKNSF